MTKEEKEYDFLEIIQESQKIMGFWNEIHKSVLIKTIERTYISEVTRDYGISDIVINSDKVLLKWFKRHQRLSNQELKDNYGKTYTIAEKRKKRSKKV